MILRHSALFLLLAYYHLSASSVQGCSPELAAFGQSNPQQAAAAVQQIGAFPDPDPNDPGPSYGKAKKYGKKTSGDDAPPSDDNWLSSLEGGKGDVDIFENTDDAFSDADEQWQLEREPTSGRAGDSADDEDEFDEDEEDDPFLNEEDDFDDEDDFEEDEDDDEDDEDDDEDDEDEDEDEDAEPELTEEQQKTIDATRIILKLDKLVPSGFVFEDIGVRNLSPHDIASMKMTPFTCLPPQIRPEFPVIYGNIPPEYLERELYNKEVEACLADVISQMPCYRIKKMGAQWLDILPLLQGGTWDAVSPRAIHCAPWYGIISHMPPSQWGELPPEAMGKLPPMFWAESPPETFQYLNPKGLAGVDASAFKDMPPSTIQYLPWGDMTEHLSSADIFNVMSADQLRAVPWDEVVPKMHPKMLGDMNTFSRYYISPEGMALATPLQIRSVFPSLLAKMPVKTLRMIPKDTYKRLGFAYLRAMPPDVLTLVTNGSINMDPVGGGPTELRRRRRNRRRNRRKNH